MGGTDPYETAVDLTVWTKSVHWVSEKVWCEPENKAACDCIWLPVTPSGLLGLCMHFTVVGRLKGGQPLASRTLSFAQAVLA